MSSPTSASRAFSQRKKRGLFFLALFFISTSLLLGCWQLARMQQKKGILAQFNARMSQTILPNQWSTMTDLRYFQTRLRGHFDNGHSLLLDNKIMDGKVGYEVYTPFHANGLKQPILVDRGFIPLGPTRASLPPIRPINGTIAINGLLNLPPGYFTLGPMTETNAKPWPLRVEFIQIDKINALLPYTLFPYVLSLKQDDPIAYPIRLQIVAMGPERHLGYAVQWFALALALLILSFVMIRRT